MDNLRNRARFASICLLLLIALPILYLLSSGPVAWLLGDGMGMDVWNTLYRPAGWLSERTGTAGIYLRYVDWWTRR